MPNDNTGLDASTSAAIASSINQASSYMAASNLNRKTQRFAREMYEKERADALADWQLQNLYNSPKAQMARLRDAGLNPNLIYGGGAGNMQASQIDNTKHQSWNPTVPPTDFGNPIIASQDAAIKSAQLDNLTAQNTLIHNNALRVMADTINTGVKTEDASFNLRMKKFLEGITQSQAQANLDLTYNQISSIANRDEREAIMQGHKIDEILERIAYLRFQNGQMNEQKLNEVKERIKLYQQQGRLRQYDEWLQDKTGMPSNAPWYIKAIMSIFGEISGKR